MSLLLVVIAYFAICNCDLHVIVEYTAEPAVLDPAISGIYTESFTCTREEGGAWFGDVDYAHCFRKEPWLIWNTGCGWEIGQVVPDEFDPQRTEWQRKARYYTGQCNQISETGKTIDALTTTTFYDGFGSNIADLASFFAAANATTSPTQGQTNRPSLVPTHNPTNIPTQTTNDPTTQPNQTPTNGPSDNPTKSPTDYEFCLDNSDNGFVTLNNEWSEVICEFCVCRDHTISDSICDIIDFNNIKTYDSYLINRFMQKCGLDQECSFKQVGLKRPSEEITLCNCDLFQCNPQTNDANTFIFGVLVVLETIIAMFSLI